MPKGLPETQPKISDDNLRWMGAPETLHPDLVKCIEPGSLGYRRINHPYLVDIYVADPYQPSHENAFRNSGYLHKCHAIPRARAKRDWFRFVWLHSRPYRLDAFMTIKDELRDQHYWRLLGEVWTDCNYPSVQRALWSQLWRSRRRLRPLVMNHDERKALVAMPDRLTIYRGASGKRAVRSGQSWTLNRDQAKWFALRNFRVTRVRPISGAAPSTKLIRSPI